MTDQNGNVIDMEKHLQGHMQEPLAECFLSLYLYQRYGINHFAIEKKMGFEKGRWQPEHILPKKKQ